MDGHNFPSLPLMKLSAWHRKHGDSVNWYDPLTAWKNPPDRVYMSKVFSFTHDYQHPVHAGEIIKGGTGYQYPDGGDPLPYDVEHIYPDYDLYPDLCKDTAYGFLTRGCPRGCAFCVVGSKEGKRSRKVADLSEFWRGQKNIVLMDPNLIACEEWENLIGQLIESRSMVDFSQGLDIRLITEKKAEMISKIKTKNIHFAWDRYQDKEEIIPKFRMFKEVSGLDKRKLSVYVLTNFNTTIEQDLERIYTLRELGYNPYVMIYEKEKLPKGHVLFRLQRWVNSKFAFAVVNRFEDYTSVKKL